jgi:uncharacterized membrane protein required for colicin V production
MDFALILDVVFVIILLLSAGVAFLRGLVREVLTILGLIGATLATLAFAPMLSPGIEGWLIADIPEADLEDAKLWGTVPYDIAASAIAYIGMFVITLITLSIISHFIAKSVHAIGLGPIDRSLGVIFGVVRGFVLIGLLYLPFHILMNEDEKTERFETSHTITYVEYSAEILLGLMPESWSRDTDPDKDEPIDPLKDLTGEEDTADSNPEIGTDEGEAERLLVINGDVIEERTLDILKNNPDRVWDIIRSRDEEPTNEPAQ